MKDKEERDKSIAKNKKGFWCIKTYAQRCKIHLAGEISLNEKRGQLKIQEMAFVLLGVVFLMALVLLFFVAFQSKEMAKSAAYYREARAITLLEVVASLPELRCSSSFSETSESVCLDYDKVNFFNSKVDIQNRYSVLWDGSYVSKIEIEEVYPKGRAYVIYSKPTTENVKSYATYSALCVDETKGLICRIARIKVAIIMPTES